MHPWHALWYELLKMMMVMISLTYWKKTVNLFAEDRKTNSQ